MSSRDKILSAVKQNQPSNQDLPALEAIHAIQFPDIIAHFTNTLQGIGGKVVIINDVKDIAPYLLQNFTDSNNYISTIDNIDETGEIKNWKAVSELDGVEVAVMKALFGVAENGSVYLTEKEMALRVLPFICQHLAVVLHKKDLVHNMHEAYKRIGNENYGFAAFIAGPSKTADIEQSLVLGAHGPKSMTIFLI